MNYEFIIENSMGTPCYVCLCVSYAMVMVVLDMFSIVVFVPPLVFQLWGSHHEHVDVFCNDLC